MALMLWGSQEVSPYQHDLTGLVLVPKNLPCWPLKLIQFENVFVCTVVCVHFVLPRRCSFVSHWSMRHSWQSPAGGPSQGLLHSFGTPSLPRDTRLPPTLSLFRPLVRTELFSWLYSAFVPLCQMYVHINFMPLVFYSCFYMRCRVNSISLYQCFN